MMCPSLFSAGTLNAEETTCDLEPWIPVFSDPDSCLNEVKHLLILDTSDPDFLPW